MLTVPVEIVYLSYAAFVCIVKSSQLCPTLYDLMDYSLPGSSLSMGYSRQEYWSGFPCPSPGDLPNPGTEPTSLTSPALEADFYY